jgi:hypothetical protein
MKRPLLISFVLIIFITLTASVREDNGKAGYTGSPGENTCASSNCHNSYTLNSGGGSISATSTMTNWKYEPLVTYTITIKVARMGNDLFGFGAEMLSSTNANAGSWTITDPVRTQVKSRTVSSVSRKNVVHQLNGGAFQDSALFTFDWTAPDTTTGNVTLYFAGNAANGNGQTGGDYVYTGSQLITPLSTNKVPNIITTDPFTVFPNPANNKIALHYFLQKNENVIVKLYDMNGSVVHTLLEEEQMAGENNKTLNIPDNCKPGIYLLSIESASGQSCRKLAIN